jgi:hypothetical protein
MSAYWEASCVDNLARAFDFMGAPFLHRRPVYVLSLMLYPNNQPLLSRTNSSGAHTSNAIQLMGSSSGISVFFTNSSFSVSSSNATVIIY